MRVRARLTPPSETGESSINWRRACLQRPGHFDFSSTIKEAPERCWIYLRRLLGPSSARLINFCGEPN
jgi:hypothetical protein